MSNLKTQQGMVMVLTVLVLLVGIMLLVAGIARGLVAGNKHDISQLGQEQAQAVAQAGMNYIIAYANKNAKDLAKKVKKVDFKKEINAINKQLKKKGQHGEILALMIKSIKKVDGGEIFELAARGRSADEQVEVAVCQQLVSIDMPGKAPDKIGSIGGSWRDYGCAI